MGRVEQLWIKRMRKGPMDPSRAATFVADAGILGNANQGGRRQVTVIEQEVFQRVAQSLPDAQPVMRRANVMVSGVPLQGSRNQILHLGDVRVLVQGETRPCERMDEQCPGLTQALDPEWNGGVYGVVLDDGEVAVGDEVRLEESHEES